MFISKEYLLNTYSINLYLSIYLVTAILGLFYYQYIRKIIFLQIRAEVFIRIIFKIIIALPFSILCGLRDISVGFDTYNYIRGFEKMANETYISSQGSFAFLYHFIFKVIAKTTNGNSVYMLFGMAMLSLVLIETAFEKVCRKGAEFSIGLILFMLYLSPIMMDQSRQFIGVGFVTLAYAYLLNNKKRLCIFFILIGMFFHETASVMLIFLLLDNRVLSGKKIKIFIFMFLILNCFLMPVLLQLVYIFLPDRYSYLITAQEKTVIGKGWIIDLFPLMISMFIYYNHIKKMYIQHNAVLESAIWSSFFFRIAGYYSFFIMRMSYYGESLSILVIIYVLFHHKCKKLKIYIFILLLAHFLHWWIDFVILGLNAAIPYRFK